MMKDYMNDRFITKHIGWLYILVLVLGTVVSLMIPKQELAAQADPLVIPDEAIRLRILANSDSDKDQDIKREIRDAVNAEITKWVEDLTSIDEARTTITSQLDEVEKIAQQKLAEQGLNYSVKVDFGNTQFPTKLYGQFLYPAGTYEAILITLGEGQGANWWCVLFPPLCFLDFSSSLAVSPGFEEETAENDKENVEKVEMPKEKVKTEEDKVEIVDNTVEKTKDTDVTAFIAEEEEEVEVKFFIVELFNKIF